MGAAEIRTVKGGCACQAIRYQLNGQMGFSFHCQCRDCQYLSGTGHISVFICKDAELDLNGEMTWYARTAPSGNIVRSGFCPICGTPVINQNSGFAGNLFVAAATLDDPSEFTPTKVVHRDGGLDWDLSDPEVTG